MYELKTKKNKQDVEYFLGNIENEKRRKDGFILLDLMRKVTGEEANMWGESIVGFGNYHYKYKSGQEGDWFLVGFSPRKQNMSVYLTHGFEGQGELLDKIGKHKLGKGCLYINKVEDIDIGILEKLVAASYDYKPNA